MQASNAAFTQQSDGHYPQQRRGINFVFSTVYFFYIRIFFCHQQCDGHYPQQLFGHIYKNTQYKNTQQKKNTDGSLYQDTYIVVCVVKQVSQAFKALHLRH